jgi:hypothetical protein
VVPEIREKVVNQVLLNHVNSNQFSHKFDLAGASGKSESPKLANTWKDRDNTEQSNPDDDARLQEFMEDIKRYIRSIDISNL